MTAQQVQRTAAKRTFFFTFANLKMSQVVLVTGPFGQIGSELIPVLQQRYGVQNVICLAHKTIPAWYKVLARSVRCAC
jgi:hypothetical protein